MESYTKNQYEVKMCCITSGTNFNKECISVFTGFLLSECSSYINDFRIATDGGRISW